MIAMSYNKYPKEMKEAIIARMLEGDETVTDIQRDTGVGINTLYRWRDQAKHQKGLSATTKYKNADKWSSQDKFMVVLETANLTEIEFSEYCREKGVYPEQVKELARKEKALAEAAALLVLRKKADAIWGTDEEDE